MEPFFIDTGGVDLLVAPKDNRILKFWRRFPAGTKHFLCHIVYWEYLRQFSPNSNSVSRQRFLHLIKKGGLEFLQFGKDEAEIAVDIYTGLKGALPRTADGKMRPKDMHCDMTIAAIAVSRRKQVLTQDVGDWAAILNVVERKKLGKLRVSDQRDILG